MVCRLRMHKLSRSLCVPRELRKMKWLYHLMYVLSLFTSIPVKMAVDVVKRRLPESHKWKGCTLLTAQQVVNLLVFVLNNSFLVKFQGNFFPSKFRMCHGIRGESPLSRNLLCKKSKE